jgi:hypothetical protein
MEIHVTDFGRFGGVPWLSRARGFLLAVGPDLKS